MKRIAYLILLFSILTTFTLSAQHISPNGDSYTKLKIQGFTVMVRTEIVGKDFTNKFVELLTENLKEINKILKPEYLKVIKSRPLWLEESEDKGVATYHPSEKWLKENGWNTDFAACSQYGNLTKAYASMTSNQPYVILHELAHLSHHNIFGYDNKDIDDAYKNAKESGKYDSVDLLTHDGRIVKQKAYGMNNNMEYFSELTEAYFGKNDFYPFDYAQLKEFDPQGFEVMRKLWGDRKVTSHKK